MRIGDSMDDFDLLLFPPIKVFLEDFFADEGVCGVEFPEEALSFLTSCLMTVLKWWMSNHTALCLLDTAVSNVNCNDAFNLDISSRCTHISIPFSTSIFRFLVANTSTYRAQISLQSPTIVFSVP